MICKPALSRKGQSVGGRCCPEWGKKGTRFAKQGDALARKEGRQIDEVDHKKRGATLVCPNQQLYLRGEGAFYIQIFT